MNQKWKRILFNVTLAALITAGSSSLAFGEEVNLEMAQVEAYSQEVTVGQQGNEVEDFNSQEAANQQESAEQSQDVILHFDLNGGKGEAPKDMTLSTEGELTLPSGTGLTKDDAVFLGWAFSKSASKAQYGQGESVAVDKLMEVAGQSNVNEATITLYAIWQEVTEQTVTYINGSTVLTETVKTGDFPKEVPEITETERPFLGWKDEKGQTVDPSKIAVMGNVTYTAKFGVLLNSKDHIRYLNGDTSGCFFPGKELSRAEAAQLFYTLIEEKTKPTTSFTDVAADAWYGQAVNTLATMEIINGYGETFEPNKKISRAEFIVLLSRFFPLEDSNKTFSDVSSNYWAKNAISSAAAKGWTSGYPDGTFKPDQSISRAEVAAMVNRVLGRYPDATTIESSQKTRVFLDLDSKHWAYYQIMEASIAHTYTKTSASGEQWTDMTQETTPLATGFYNYNGYLYLVEQGGLFAKQKTVGNFTFDNHGKYTTGNTELDERIVGIIAGVTNSGMTQEQKLRALYDYVRDNYSYLKRDLISADQTDWENGFALEMLQIGKGNCYSFAATYYQLSKALGYDSKTVVGLVGQRRDPHGWVDITIDGTLYLFDVELEMAYRAKGTYSYNLFKMTYGKTPFVYERL